MRVAALLVGITVAFTLAGCGGGGGNLPATVPASGTVTLDGAPVEGASVQFIAESGDHHATGMTDASGKFTLRAFEEKTGAVPGSYKVTVNKTVISDAGGEEGEATVNVQFGLPTKYSTIASTDLKATIPEGGTSDLKLELSSK